MSDSPPEPRPAPEDRTMVVNARHLVPPRAWKPFAFTGLEQVSRNEVKLLRRLQWLLPMEGPATLAEAVSQRIKALVESDVRFVLDHVRTLPHAGLRRELEKPTFLAVLGAGPSRGRALLEVELSLAHAVVDLLLGGAGESVGGRPLTDIEEGVMSYVVLEVLRALSPSLEPAGGRLQLEGVAHGAVEGLSRLGEEGGSVLVVQLKASIGAQAGFVRFLVPAAVIERSEPSPTHESQAARLKADLLAHAHRLSGVKTWLRAEIGSAEIASSDLSSLREKDVVLLEGLSVRPDRGEEGTALLRVGKGLAGLMDAALFLEEGVYRARITDIRVGEGGYWNSEAEVEEDNEPGAAPPSEALEGESVEEGAKREGSDLLGDIPLQLSVELARVPLGADEIVGLRVGQVVDLKRGAAEPVELSVNGKVIARGELVEIEGQLGVRVLSLAD